MNTIHDHRVFYANLIVRGTGSSNERLVGAFSSVEREHYVGKGPWAVSVIAGHIFTISDDPRLLYQDILVSLATDRGINNGQPSLHAKCLAACAPTEGELVVHVGAGTGYYTAILAALVGPTGKVLAFEIQTDLADRARENLKDLPNVTVLNDSTADAHLPNSDVIYVNAGATHPLASWLDALKVGGRLILPLTPNDDLGCMLLVTRETSTGYAASVVARVAFIQCVGARDDLTSNALAAALETQSIKGVRSLHRGTNPDSTAWCVGTGWWLSTAAPK